MILLAFLFSVGATAASMEYPETEGWKVHRFDTYQSLKEGTLENSGANLFLSHRGVIAPIRSWDYNQDGYADILFNNNHDHAFEIPAAIHLNKAGTPEAEASIKLPTSGGASVAVADLLRSPQHRLHSGL